MGQVTVTFKGICTHFHSALAPDRPGLPGVPHRVVLVNGAMLRVGIVQLPDTAEPSLYWIMPHTTVVTCEGVDFRRPGSPIFGDGGQLVIPSILTVPNTVDTGVSYPTSPTDANQSGFLSATPPVESFVPPASPFRYSPDVVMNGRASAYFDISAGSVMAVQEGGEWLVQATINTAKDDLPVLRVTPFGAIQAVDYLLPETAQLTVRNDGFGCSASRDLCQWDFLLHLETEQRGIPRFLGLRSLIEHKSTTSTEDEPLTLKMLRTLSAGIAIKPGQLPFITDDFGNPPNDSCADSRYP